MSWPQHCAIIIQARMGSTRLPGKMLKPFYEGRSLAEVIFSKLSQFAPETNIILATSSDRSNDQLASCAESFGFQVFRGHETDVLQRFIDAAEEFNISHIVRVCADNPLLSADHVRMLPDNFHGCDYLSFRMSDGLPVITSHLGMFAEMVKVDALKKVRQFTKEAFYHEHVTNYIYTHPELFSIKWLDLPEGIGSRRDIRLTIDTSKDFETAATVFKALQKNEFLNVDVNSVISYLDHKPEIIESMKYEIERNAK